MARDKKTICITISSTYCAVTCMTMHRLRVRCIPGLAGRSAKWTTPADTGGVVTNQIEAAGWRALGSFARIFERQENLGFPEAVVLAVWRSFSKGDGLPPTIADEVTDPQVLVMTIIIAARLLGWPKGEPIRMAPPDYAGPSSRGVVRGHVEVCVPSDKRWSPDRLVEAGPSFDVIDPETD